MKKINFLPTGGPEKLKLAYFPRIFETFCCFSYNTLAQGTRIGLFNPI